MFWMQSYNILYKQRGLAYFGRDHIFRKIDLFGSYRIYLRALQPLVVVKNSFNES